MSAHRSGFTVVEMLIAITMLGIGLLALAAGSGSVTRTLNGSRIATQASQLAAWRMDMLRAYGRSTVPACIHAQFTNSAGAQTMYKVSQTWTIVPNGELRTVNVFSTYAVSAGRARTDTLSTTVDCSI